MKIIDEKGRLFGWINLLDLTVLIGVIAALFVGVSAWVALRQQPLEIQNYSPTEIQAGSAARLTIRLKSDRDLSEARLLLAPEPATGSSFSISGTLQVNERDSVVFSIPADIPAGSYTARLETTARDVFGRQAVITALLSEAFVVRNAEKIKPATVVYDGKCSWTIEFDAVLIASAGEMPALSTGDSLFDPLGVPYLLTGLTGTIPDDRLEALPKSFRNRDAMFARLKVTAGFDSLGALLQAKGSRLPLKFAGQDLMAAPGKDASVQLDMLFYLSEPAQLGLLTGQTELSDQGGKGRAVIVHSFGDVDNPWVSRASVFPENGMPRAFDVSRVLLNCTLGNDGLYFGRTRLEPNRLIGFQAGGAAITGGILSLSQPQLSTVVRVMVEAFPVQLAKLLVPGIAVSDIRSKQPAGMLIRVVDSDQLDSPEILLLNSRNGFGKDFKRILLDLEVSCTLNRGVPFVFGQQINFGQSLNFYMLGQQLTGVIKYDNKLPLRGMQSQESVQVEFRNVPPELVAWIREGEQEYTFDGMPNWKIERIISSEPSKVYLPNAEGTKLSISDHPENKTIHCLVRLHATKIGSDVHYKGNLLKIGASLGFEARKWSYSATLVAF